MNIFVFALVIVGCVYHTVGDTTVPVSFVTEESIRGGPSEQNYFHVRLCGGFLYDNQAAVVHINQPNRPWNELQGDFVKCDVRDATNSQIISGNNGINGHTPTFTFIYRKEYGDLLFKCTTPNSPGSLEYTLEMRFPDSSKRGGSVTKEVRYVSTEAEMSARNNIEQWLKSVSEHVFFHDLVSVFLTNEVRKVETQDNDQLVLNYCFPSNKPGYIDVAVTAVDQKSGFATYVCPGESGDCSASSPYYDGSGASVNLVKTLIKNNNNAGPVKVMVRGDGRPSQANSYLLTASKFNPQKNTDTCNI